jgi:hypothetical protein
MHSVNRNLLRAIDILNVVSTVVEDHIEISWQTSQQENNYLVVIERSVDAIDFTQLDTIYITGSLPYTYIDSQPISGTSYYRIRCICSVTQIESISNLTYIEYEVQQKDSFEILNSFPVPFSGTLNTSIRCKTNMLITLKLRDLTGSLIYESSKMCIEGINTVEFSEILNTGNSFYYLTLTDENSNVKTIQLLKQNAN